MKIITVPAKIWRKRGAKRLMKALIALVAVAITAFVATGCGDDQQTKTMREEAEELKGLIEGRWECGNADAGEIVWGYEFSNNGKGVEFGVRGNAGGTGREREITYAVRGKRVSLVHVAEGTESGFEVLLIDSREMLIRYDEEIVAYTLRKTTREENGGNGNNGGNSGSGNTGGSQPGNDVSTEDLIADNVSVGAIYDDFHWHFTVTSTLEKALPDACIDFKVEHGDADYDFYQVIGANGHVTVEDYAEHGIRTVVMSYPFYYYFFARYMLTGYAEDESAFRRCEQLFELLKGSDRGQDDVADENRNSQNEELKRYEQQAKGRYKLRILVAIDGKHYPVAKFTM